MVMNQCEQYIVGCTSCAAKCDPTFGTCDSIQTSDRCSDSRGRLDSAAGDAIAQGRPCIMQMLPAKSKSCIGQGMYRMSMLSWAVMLQALSTLKLGVACIQVVADDAHCSCHKFLGESWFTSSSTRRANWCRYCCSRGRPAW